MSAKLMVLYNPPVDPAAFDAHYAETHIPLVKQIPGLWAIELSTGPVATPDGTTPYHSVAVFTFDSMDAVQAAMGSPEGAAATADLANFVTGGATVLMFETREVQ